MLPQPARPHAPSSTWAPTDAYLKVVAANRRYYAHTAALYDTTESCVADRGVQCSLERDLDRVLGHLERPRSALRALDACGGTGNVALKLLARGVTVTLVDVSPDLTALFAAKCNQRGLRPDVVHEEIGAFLASQNAAYDIIIFSSALHHLQDFRAVLCEAHRALTPGGLLFTAFDPTLSSQNGPVGRLVAQADYYLFKLARQTSDLPGAIVRRLRRTIAGASPTDKHHLPLNDATAGMLAEFHVEHGIDDIALVQFLRRAAGYAVVFHEREGSARFAWARLLHRHLGSVTSFKLLLQKRPTSR